MLLVFRSNSITLMEPTPSSSFLAIFEKKTTQINLYRPLRHYIAFNYSERKAQNLEDNLQTLKFRLRAPNPSHADPVLEKVLFRLSSLCLLPILLKMKVTWSKFHVPMWVP